MRTAFHISPICLGYIMILLTGFLICQAIVNDLWLVTADELIRAYPGPIFK
jgi:hypothetical protein